MNKIIKEEKQKCNYCKKSLVSIGNERENGKNHIDWKTRKYHKKCYKIVIESKFFNDILT